MLRSPGRSLDPAARAEVEPRFGYDFDQVRVHTDAQAAESARSIGAQAYTLGGDVVFGAGKYAPGTSEGRRLLAHELTHVVQQQGRPRPGTTRPGVGEPDTAEEHTADRAAEAAMRGWQMPVLSPSRAGVRIQRQTTGERRVAETIDQHKIETLLEHLARRNLDVDDLAAELTDTEMRSLVLADRIRLIDYIARGTVVGNEDETTIVRLLAAVPAADAAVLLAWLRTNNSALLQALDDAIDGAEYRQYHQVLRTIFLRSMGPREAQERMGRAPEFPWADPGLIGAVYNKRFYYERPRFTNTGKLSFTFWALLGPFGMKQAQNVEVDPLEMIRVRFYLAEPEIGAQRGKVIYMPAINLLSLYHKQFRQELWSIVDVALLFAGGAGLITAGTKVRRVIAAIDLLLGTTDVAVREFRENIAGSQVGREFLEAWDALSFLIGVYGAGRVLVATPAAFRRLRDAYRNFRARSANALNPQQANRLNQDMERIFQQADEAEQELRASQPGPIAAPDQGGQARGTATASPDRPAQASTAAPPAPQPATTPPGPQTTAAPLRTGVPQRALATHLRVDPAIVAGLTDAQSTALAQLVEGASRDRRLGLGNVLRAHIDRGREPQRLVDFLNKMEPRKRGRYLEMHARISWPRNWRGRPIIEHGNLEEGWQHIEARHITGTHPDGPGDLFPAGTSRRELQEAANDVVANGVRLSEPGRRMQTFESRITVHGRSDRVRIRVDASDGRVITIFPVITGP
ncbi:MAG: eCIS core domain-containing protein [Actinomycetota bacterium]